MSRPDDVPGRDSHSRIVPAPYPSRRSLAQALDMAESTVDEMVKRGVLPPPNQVIHRMRALVLGGH